MSLMVRDVLPLTTHKENAMAIIGFNDTLRLRRNGKIRAGYKDEKNNNKLINTDYFLLHDAPGVAESIGEKPTEIYFTMYTDSINDVCVTDLRWYNQSQLMCKSMHGAPDENGVDMGMVAAFRGVGIEAKGLMNKPFPRIDAARVRQCSYKGCQDYVLGKCSEHMFLNFMIPQHSMGEVFTLDSTSLNAILNASDVLYKAMIRYGRISGQIFKMYKAPGEIKFQKKDGSQGKSEAQMVYFSVVDFNEYEHKFKNSIKPDDWEALMNMRSSHYALGNVRRALSGSNPAEELQAPDEQSRLEASKNNLLLAGAGAGDEEALRAKAMDPALTPFFEEYGSLIGKEATEKIRIATMRSLATVEEGIKYLKTKIKEVKKAKGTAPATVADKAAAIEQAPPPQLTDVPPPVPPEGPGSSFY